MTALPPDIQKLIERHLKGISNAEEEQKLEKWRKTDKLNEERYQNYKAKTDSAKPAAEDAKEKEQRLREEAHEGDTPSATRLLRIPTYLKYILMVLLFFAVLWLGIYFTGSDVYRTGAGERQVIMLSDNSRVILGEQSRLAVGRLYSSVNREVNLIGRAYFDVQIDGGNAFTVLGGKSICRALGTAFYYTATDDSNLVSVSEGKLAFWQLGQSDTLVLQEGQSGFVRHGQLQRAEGLALKESWRNGNFQFEQASLYAVISELQDYYHFNLVAADKWRQCSCTYSGRFAQAQLSDILSEISQATGVEWAWIEDGLVLRQDPCS